LGKPWQKLNRKALSLIPFSDMRPDFFFSKGTDRIPNGAFVISEFEIQRAPPQRFGTSTHGYSSMPA
jgi:hypothetical protein